MARTLLRFLHCPAAFHRDGPVRKSWTTFARPWQLTWKVCRNTVKPCHHLFLKRLSKSSREPPTQRLWKPSCCAKRSLLFVESSYQITMRLRRARFERLSVKRGSWLGNSRVSYEQRSLGLASALFLGSSPDYGGDSFTPSACAPSRPGLPPRSQESL